MTEKINKNAKWYSYNLRNWLTGLGQTFHKFTQVSSPASTLVWEPNSNLVRLSVIIWVNGLHFLLLRSRWMLIYYLNIVYFWHTLLLLILRLICPVYVAVSSQFCMWLNCHFCTWEALSKCKRQIRKNLN